MKKNFFKKLSFVMALAMMVSVIAPAASAFAAAKPALNATSKTLLLGNEDKSEYDFNVNNKVKGATYTWASSNKKVATVDKNGYTTAVGIGSATITVKIVKAKKVVKSLSAKVTVLSNIASLAIVAPAGVDTAKLAPATDYAFSRTFKTESGSTTKTTSVTKWSVSEGATITSAGVFKADSAGTYTITVSAFQSKSSKTALTSKELEVTVAYGIKEVKQVSTTSFNVVFNSDMSNTDVAKSGVLSKIVAGKDTVTGSEKIKSATLDTTGKILTVVTFTEFTAKAVYNFTFEAAKGTFTAASTTLADVKGIVFKDMKVNIDGLSAPDMRAYVAGVNADGVEIIAASTTSAIAPYLSFKYNGDLGKGYTSGNFAYIYSDGYSATITANYVNSIYNETSKVYEPANYTATGNATGVAKAVDASSLLFALATGAVPSTYVWSTTPGVAAKDSGYKINTKYKFNTDLASADYTFENYASSPKFIYESTNTDKLIITGNTVLPISEGTVTVIVKNVAYPNAVVGTFDVVIKAARTLGEPVYLASSIVSGNTSYYTTNAMSAMVLVQDTMGERISSLVVGTPSKVSGPTGTAPTVTASQLPAGATRDRGIVKVNVIAGTGVTAGAYNYSVPVTATFNGVTVTKNLSMVVMVVDGVTNSAVYKWQVDLNNTEFDLLAPTGASTVDVKVNAYNSAGIIVDSLTTAEYSVKTTIGNTDVSELQNIPYLGTSVVTGVTVAAKNSVAATPILYGYLPGTYTVTVSLTNAAVDTHASLTGRAVTATIGVVSFTVKDTTTKSVTQVSPVVTNSVATPVTTVKQAVLAAYNFTLNGNDITEANITSITFSKGGAYVTSNGSDAVAAGDNLYIVSVEYSVSNPTWVYSQPMKAASTSVYTYDIAGTVTVK